MYNLNTQAPDTHTYRINGVDIKAKSEQDAYEEYLIILNRLKKKNL